MDNILDHVVVQGQRYDIVSPTAFGDYIETIGSACINPDGYAQGSTFLARLGNEQFYYEATAAITQGSAILEGTNCKKTTVTGREAELTSEIETLGETVDSLNEALSNEVTTRATLGAHNLLPINATTQVINGVTWTANSDGSVSASGTVSSYSFIDGNSFTLRAGTYILSGRPNVNYTYIALKRKSPEATIVSITSGTEVSFTLSSDTEVFVRLGADAGFSQSNAVTFYPMLRLATDTDPTYQPYAMTNRELTEDISTIKGMPYDLLASASATENNVTIPNINQYRYIIASCGTIGANKNNLINPAMIPVSLFKKLEYVYSGYAGTSAGSLVVMSTYVSYISDTSIRIYVSGSTDVLVYGVK